MDAAEAADHITETAEERHREAMQEHEEKVAEHEAKERFRNRAALTIAILAAMLAVCELASALGSKRMSAVQWSKWPSKAAPSAELSKAMDEWAGSTTQCGPSCAAVWPATARVAMAAAMPRAR